MNKKKAILIIGHGSDSVEESAAEMHAKVLRERGYENVFYAYKDYASPLIRDVMQEITKEHTEVVVIPLFIGEGYFTETVIPERLGLPDKTYSGAVDVDGKKIQIDLTGAFGTDPRMADIVGSVAERLMSGSDSGLLLIGHGSRGNKNKDMVMINAESLKEEFKNVYIAFNEFNDPEIENALTEMEKDGIKEIVAIPMFVSPGGHTDEDLPEKLGIPEGGIEGSVCVNGREIPVMYTQPIGMEPGVSDILEGLVKPFL